MRQINEVAEPEATLHSLRFSSATRRIADDLRSPVNISMAVTYLSDELPELDPELLPEELFDPEEPLEESLLELSELLLPGELLLPEDELSVPPGVSAPPVAVPLLETPKYENTLCRHPG